MKKNYVYIHIPFCNSKCSYCRFASIGSIQKYQIQKYCHFLGQEIRDFNSEKREKIESIYFGGGTPSTLTKQQLGEIFKILKEKFIWSDDIEITLETTPENVDFQNLCDWRELGINRISIGIQTLNEKSLQEIGRNNKGDIHKTLQCLDEFYKKYPENNCVISLDFIIGLPFVALGELQKDIAFVCENYSFIQHISVYMLEEYYEISQENKQEKNIYENIVYPNDWRKLGISEDLYLQEYSDIKKYLSSQGFEQYEISNYAKNNKYCHHNYAYWTRQNIYAFGLSASGYKNNHRYTNSEKFDEYYNKKNIVIEKLTKDDVILENIMFALRTKGIDTQLIKHCDEQKINEFLEYGLLEKQGEYLKLTDKGVLLMDKILQEI